MPIKTLARDHTRNPLARVLDFGCVIAAYATTAAIASGLARADMFIWPAPASSDIMGWPAQYVVLLLTAVIAWGAVAARLKIYGPVSEAGLSGHLRQFGAGALLWTAAIGVAIFLFKLSDVSRLFVLCFVFLGSVFIVLCGNLERVFRLRQQEKQGIAVVIGHGAQSEWLTEYLRRHFSPRPYALVKRSERDDLATLGTSGAHLLNNQTGTNGTKTSVEAFVAGADIYGDAAELIPCLLKRGIKTHIMPAVFDASIFRLSLGDIGGVPLITIRGGELDPLEAGVKRVIDFAGSLLVLMLVAPVMAVVALLVKISSPGPVLFRQERLGKDGRRIHIYKFRTMQRDAESILKANDELYHEYLTNNYKLPGDKDPRITRVGRVLRQLSLDELPQLINVLKGEMSLVGPRPVVPDEIERYGDCASMVLSVQPGLTGQWQVSGRSDIADYAERVQLDLEYLRDRSIATDLRILVKTVPAVLLRQGAH